MFIKKDLRKIPTILVDAATKAADDDDVLVETIGTAADDERKQRKERLTDLPLQRRKAEFQGSVKILCQPCNAPALTQLKSLSLYDCEISDLTGIGLCENLVSLNVGRNPIQDLPLDDFEKLTSLKTLILDDCQLQGPLSRAITGLGSSLHELRLSNNRISDLTEHIANLSSLEILGLDGNQLTCLPDDLTELLNLRILLLRSNQLTELPDLRGLISLQLLHVSSNRLQSDALVGAHLAECGCLTHVYANSNPCLSILPVGVETLPDLQHFNVAHNAIQHLSDALLLKWGEPDDDGVLGRSQCRVVLTGNPVLSVRKQNKNSATVNDNTFDMEGIVFEE